MTTPVVTPTAVVDTPRRWIAAGPGYAIRRNLIAYAFLLPALLVFGFFAWYPIIRGFLLSFQKVDLISPSTWVGWDNFRLVIHDPLFRRAIRNTLEFAGLALLIGYLVPFILAVAINETRHLQGYFRLAFYVPVVLPPIVSVFLWQWIYDPGNGLANTALGWFGIDPQAWLQSATLALPSMVVLATWTYAGSTMLIYLAALQGIPPTLYDAAEVDGAGVWRRFVDILLPQMRYIMLITLILQIIGTMQIFTEPFVLTDGGPNNATITIMLLLYRYAFQYSNFGGAGALGFMLFIALSVLSALYLLATRRFAQ